MRVKKACPEGPKIHYGHLRVKGKGHSYRKWVALSISTFYLTARMPGVTE